MSGVFGSYVALGDSMSIDQYPGPGLGAASLLFRNREDRFPDFSGRDLLSLNPEVAHTNLARDGATTHDVLRILSEELPDHAHGPVLVSLTIGGNDLLGSVFRPGSDPVTAIAERIEGVIQEIRTRLAPHLILLGTIYDPTDGVGDLWTHWQTQQTAIDALRGLNDQIRSIGAKHQEVVVAEVHDHFLGHGRHFEDTKNPHYCTEDPTCWVKLRIEPNSRGGSEVRRAFWAALTRRQSVS